MSTRTPGATQTPTLTPVVVEGTVSIWHAWQGEELTVLAQILADFNLVYPEVYFDVTYVPFADLLPKFRDSAAAGRGPTLLFGPVQWGSELYEAGLLAPLDDLAGEADFLSVINPPALQASHAADGALIGLPYWLEGVVLYRNRGLIPDPPSSLDEMRSMAALVSRGDTQGAVIDRSFFFSGAHLNGLGGDIMNSDGSPAFNTETGRAWLALLDSFETLGPTEFTGDSDLNLFKAGQAGFIIEGSWQLSDLSEAIGPDALAVDPWPTVPGGALSGFVRSENLFMNTNSQETARKAAWAFIEYFFSEPVQSHWSSLGRLPAASHTLPTDRLERELINALLGGSPYPTHPAFNQYLTTLDAALRAHLHDGVPADQVLNEAEAALLQSIQSSPAPSPTP